MVQARTHVVSVSTLLGVLAAVIAWAMVAPPAAPAVDSPAMLPTQSLFLTERFTAAGPPRGALGTGPMPEQLLALRGEREGFQVAVQNSTGAGPFAARIEPDSALAAQGASGQVTFELLRVGFVNLPQGSTRLGTSAGMYADPLPPFRNESAAGRLSIPAGQWGGVAVIAKIRTDASPGTYGGNLELYTGADRGNEIVHARQPFTLEVRGTTLKQGGSSKSFKTVLNVEGEAYWLQHDDLRNRPKGTDAWADRMTQVVGLMSFLDSRNVTPLEHPFGNPSATGPYSCAYASKGLPSMRYLDQLKSRYFGRGRDIDPGTQQFPSRMVPTRSVGCNPDSAHGGFEGTIDPRNTPGVKQDDSLNPKAPAFFRSVAGTWSSNGLWKAGSTYVKSPFDEPGDANAQQRATMNTQVPKANVELHKAVGKKAKVVLAGWPRDGRDIRKCRMVGTSKRCTTISGDAFDNRKMWDNRGSDDVDVWMPHFSRLFGRTTPPILKPYRVNRERDYANRLKSIRAKAGKETWAYNFYTATKTMPQVTIDAPGTDPRLQYLMLARDGHTGLFISNLMMGWGTTPQLHPGTNVRRKGDPYDQALYFKHPIYGVAAGWGTFIYPGYEPELGLDGETLRNTEGAVPVSSLRLEALRDGTEDANLIQQYRERFGDAKVQAVLKPIFPGTSVNYPSTLGNVVGPRYDNGNNLAQRMEAARRQMMTELG